MRHARLLLLTLLGGLGLGWAVRPGFRMALPFAGIALLAILLDALLRRRRDLPLYRRHLGVFALCLAASALAGLRFPGLDVLALLPVAGAGTAGAVAGLTLAALLRVGGRELASYSWVRGQARRPDPARPLLLVADPHWQDRLVGLEEATLAHPDADWLFLGDVFDVWVGIPGLENAAQGRFLDWVRARRAAGRWVGLWLGNREFFLDGHAGDFDLMGEGTGGRLEGEDLAFEHGDWINRRDWRYRLWNLASRSGPMWVFFSLLPGFLARRIATGLEARLRTTNRAYKLAFPREAFEAAARVEAGRTFLTGHFHTLERAANGIALPWAFEGHFWIWRNGQALPVAGGETGSTSPPVPDP